MTGPAQPAPESARFPIRDSGPAPGPQWEPGVVEVKFRDDVVPNLAGAADGKFEMESADNGLSEVNQVLRRFDAQGAESTFAISADDATDAQNIGHLGDAELPNLASFVTVHFPTDSDVVAIASVLVALPSRPNAKMR